MNRATRAIVATMGVVFGLSGMSHGIFETLQGNTPTEGTFITAIGEAHRFWIHGAEYAFTLIPNFLVTGLAAMAVGLAIIVWSVCFVHKRRGPLVFVLLFIVLLLVGGGVAQVLVFPILWAASTRTHKPLTWWRRVLPKGVRGALAKVWRWTLALSALSWLLTLEIATFGYVPGMSDPDRILVVMLSTLGVGFGTLLFSFVAGFAHDIERQG
jgi:hypothetical protein